MLEYKIRGHKENLCDYFQGGLQALIILRGWNTHPFLAHTAAGWLLSKNVCQSFDRQLSACFLFGTHQMGDVTLTADKNDNLMTLLLAMIQQVINTATSKGLMRWGNLVDFSSHMISMYFMRVFGRKFPQKKISSSSPWHVSMGEDLSIKSLRDAPCGGSYDEKL